MSLAPGTRTANVMGIMYILCGFVYKPSCSDTYLPTYYTNTCEQSGKALSCDEGYVVKIIDVRCFPLNITCPERGKIARLCDGLRSCARLDLRRQLNYNCKDFPMKKVLTSFQCFRETERPPCRMNLCGKESEDVRCKRGKIFHLQEAKCYHGQRECGPDVYKAIYKTCEGQRTCVVSDLIELLSSDACYDRVIEQSNIFMDYICVDDRVQTDNCTDRYITLTPRFGILKSPGYPHNPLGNSEGCRWAIYPEIDQVVDMYVHVAYSLEGRDDCNYRFLQVQYTVCDTGKLKTDIFCDEGRINVKIHSCGTIFVMHWAYAAGEHRGNRFLISYHVSTPGSNVAAYAMYTSPCERPDPGAEGAKYTFPKQEFSGETTEETQITTRRHLLPDDQPVNDGNASKGGVQTASSKAKNKTQRSDPWKMVTLLRVVVVNIFLGLLIIALIMALVFVCYRYKTMGRRNAQNKPPASNTATTLDDKNSTEMHPLQTEDNEIPKDRYNQTKPQPVANVANEETGELHEETTFSATPSYETTIFHFNRQPEEPEDQLIYDCKTGMTSFLPQALKRQGNPEHTYSTVGPSSENTEVKETANAQLTDSETPVTSCSQVPGAQNSGNIRDSLHHYKINNQEYAVVLKSPHRNRNFSGNIGYSVADDRPERHRVEHPCTSTEASSRGSNSQDSRTHIHPVPEDDYVSHTTMHLIPQHNCLLHKIPPPPPPVNRGYWGPP